MREWQEEADRLSAEGQAAGDPPTAWFDRLYAQGATGESTMPWDRESANPALTGWLEGRVPEPGATACQVGCGLGADAEHLAALGWRTTAFDIAPTAVQIARERHPDSSVRYRVADLFDLDGDWRFDLVVEIFTVQALPLSERERATAAVRRLVAPGGTLLVVQSPRPEQDTDPVGPPWPLSRPEMEAFADDGLRLVDLQHVQRPGLGPSGVVWRGEFRRQA